MERKFPFCFQFFSALLIFDVTQKTTNPILKILFKKKNVRFRSTSLPRNFHHGCTGLVLITSSGTPTSATTIRTTTTKLPSYSSSHHQHQYQHQQQQLPPHTNIASCVGTLTLNKCKCR